MDSAVAVHANGAAVSIVAADEGVDAMDEFANSSEGAAANGALGDQTKPAFQRQAHADGRRDCAVGLARRPNGRQSPRAGPSTLAWKASARSARARPVLHQQAQT